MADLRSRPSSTAASGAFRANGSLKMRALTVSVRDEDGDLAAFTNALKDALPPKIAAEYAAALVKHAITPDAPMDLSESHLAELGVRIGHRDVFRLVVADMRRGTGDALDDVDDGVKEPFEVPGLVPAAYQSGEPITFENGTLTFADEGEWTDFGGSHQSLDTFLDAMRNAMIARGMPTQFIRLFLDNKPLPFEMQIPIGNNRIATAMLLRVPSCDILPTERVGPHGLTTQDTTMHKVTNRLVMMYTPPQGRRPARLLTYRKDKDSTISELKTKWQNEKMADDISIEHVAIRVMRESLEVFRGVLEALQQELEVCSALPDSYRPKEVVKTLSRVQRQAAVMRRSLNGNDKVLSAIVEGNIFGEEGNAVLHLVQDLKEIADELESNAQQMLELRLAMIDFKGQMNMKLFTNMTIIVAPLGIITGWFGMNFEDMKELSIEGFYYGVVVFVVLLVTCLSLMLVWLNRDRPVSAQDAAEAQIVLRKAEKEAD
jgi:hypothetical protein